MIIKIVPVIFDNKTFYLLERPRLLRRSLWFSENWSDGGDIVKYDSPELAQVEAIFAALKPQRWFTQDLRKWGYQKKK